MKLQIPSRLVVVKNFPARSFAEAGQAFLKEQGINSIVQSSDMVGSGTSQGCDLYVEQQELDRGRELLESLFNGM